MADAGKIQVFYWPMHGRAGAVLRMLAEKGVEYEHHTEFPKIAAHAAAFGAATDTIAPPIVVDGDVTVSQSIATSMYIGNKVGFPAPDVVKAVQIASNIVDLFENGVMTVFNKGGDAFKAYIHGADGKPARFAIFAAAIERSVKGPYFFGDAPSWVDFFFGSAHAFCSDFCLKLVEKCTGTDPFAAFPKLKAIAASIQGLESASKIPFPTATPTFMKAETDPVFAALKPAEAAADADAAGGAAAADAAGDAVEEAN